MEKKATNLTLSDTERKAIRAALDGVEYDSAGGQAYIVELRRRAYSCFPARLLVALENLKASSTSHFVIDNLPIDTGVNGSPWFSETGRPFKDGVLSENVLVAIGSMMGEPYSIAHEGAELVNNLTPHRESAKAYTGLGSEVELDFHTENAAQSHRPEGDTSPQALILLGLRGEPGGNGPKTRVADARAALALLSDDDIEQLRGKHFIIRVPHRWRGSDGSGPETLLCPILSGPLDKPRITVAFYPDMVLTVDERSKQALANLHLAVKSVSVGIDVSPGRLLFVNNKFTLHSRDKFSASFDTNGRAYRWIQRLCIADSLWNFRCYNQVQERVFDPGAGSRSMRFTNGRSGAQGMQGPGAEKSDVLEIA